MTTQPAPTSEQLAWLPCLNCDGRGQMHFNGKLLPDPECPDCQGAGLRFPELTEECHNFQRYQRDEMAEASCPECNQALDKPPGRVLAVTTEKLWALFSPLTILQQYGFITTLLASAPEYESKDAFYSGEFITWWANLTEIERQEALSAAILAAEEE